MMEIEVLGLLVSEVRKAGSQSAWARERGISAAHVNDVIKRNRAPGPTILNALGLERVITYRQKDQK